MGQHERYEDGWPPPDVVIPDGTTFPEDPSTQKKYVVKAVEAAVELLLKDEASACADMSYPTDMSIPQASDFPDFTMPRIKWTCLLSRYESYGQGGVSHLGVRRVRDRLAVARARFPFLF